MTSPESRYEMDHVRSMFDGYPFSESLRSRYLKSWERWLAWCQGHNLQPGAARRDDVGRFIDQLPRHSQAYIRTDISVIYFRLGAANPARIGMAQDLAEVNTGLLSMLQVGRWKRPETLLLYIRNIAAGQNAVAGWYTRRGE